MENMKLIVVEIKSQMTTNNGQVFCNSLDVAQRFGKQHKNVLQAVEELDCSGDFRELNFQLSNYTVPGQRRNYPMYLMTRDGFTFLVMGFTGREAARFKECYIRAFNQMEEELRNFAGVEIIEKNASAQF